MRLLLGKLDNFKLILFSCLFAAFPVVEPLLALMPWILEQVLFWICFGMVSCLFSVVYAFYFIIN